MKKYISSIILAAAAALTLTACSRSISAEKLTGSWSCTAENGSVIHIELTDRTFTQSSGEATGDTLKYERTSEGANVRGTDGKVLIKLTYSEDDNTISYTVKNADGSDDTLVFTRDAQ